MLVVFHLLISLIEKQLACICFRLGIVGAAQRCLVCEFMLRHPENFLSLLTLDATADESRVGEQKYLGFPLTAFLVQRAHSSLN